MTHAITMATYSWSVFSAHKVSNEDTSEDWMNHSQLHCIGVGTGGAGGYSPRNIFGRGAEPPQYSNILGREAEPPSSPA